MDSNSHEEVQMLLGRIILSIILKIPLVSMSPKDGCHLQRMLFNKFRGLNAHQSWLRRGLDSLNDHLQEKTGPTSWHRAKGAFPELL